MADTPILLIAGLGRCGTTMVMTMLDAGGFPVTGPRPSYELADRWHLGRPDTAWINAQGGRAVKWIDPMRCLSMRNRLCVPPVIILMERNAREQSRSQIKFIETAAGKLGRRAEKAMQRSIRRDMPIVRANMASTGVTHRVDFEDALENPQWMARKLGRIVDCHFGCELDEESAARVVIPRHPSCAPHMAMETIILPSIAAELNGRGRANA